MHENLGNLNQSGTIKYYVSVLVVLCPYLASIIQPTICLVCHLTPQNHGMGI